MAETLEYLLSWSLHTLNFNVGFKKYLCLYSKDFRAWGKPCLLSHLLPYLRWGNWPTEVHFPWSHIINYWQRWKETSLLHCQCSDTFCLQRNHQKPLMHEIIFFSGDFGFPWVFYCRFLSLIRHWLMSSEMELKNSVLPVKNSPTPERESQMLQVPCPLVDLHVVLSSLAWVMISYLTMISGDR